MRYYVDLGDGGPLVECRDAEQAALLASLWLTSHRFNDRDYLKLIAVRIRSIAAVDRGPVTAWWP